VPETTPLKILLIDDDPGDFHMTRAMLESLDDFPVEVDWAATFHEAMNALNEGGYDVFLVDYFLEDRTGLDFLAEARDRAIRTPMIMITGKGSRDVDLQAMETGAADYLVKGKIDPDMLERSIRYAVERARAQEALRESEERHRGMFDHLPMGLYRCDPQGGFVDANPTLVRILGYPPPALLRERYAKSFYLADEDRDGYLAALRADGEIRGLESVILDVQGMPLRVRHTARAHRDAQGKIVYIEGALEKVNPGFGSLERAAVRYRTLVSGMELPLLRLDGEGRILDVSSTAATRFGVSAADWIARGIDELAGDGAIADVHAATEDMNGTPVSRSWTLSAGNGETVPVRLASVPDAVGEADEVLVLLDD